MRISDWSSDVCSSDLTAANTVRQCIRLLSVPSVYAPHSRAGNLTGIGRSTFYELIEAGVFETVKVGRSPSSELPASSASSRRVRELLRSEEHTYEHQSLMRITYAVFCWTKQKETNMKTKSTIVRSTRNNYDPQTH